MSDLPLYDRSTPETPLYDQATAAVPATGYRDTEPEGGGRASQAKDEAASVASDAQDATKHVAGVAKDEAANVAAEAKNHAKDLYAQATSELREQAGAQQQRAADGLKNLSAQLSSMADNADEGVAQKVVRDLASRAESLGGFLEGRDPGSLLDEVKSFAARRPGTFIAVAAGAGILAGRLTKALTTEIKHEKEADTGNAGTGGVGA